MHIGPYKLKNKLLLAPMAGVADKPFRQLCRRLGAALAVSEMVAADTSLWGSRKSIRRLDHEGEEGPIVVQILGSDPGMMAQAAQLNASFGAQIIDINMGCPAKKVCRKAAGSALLDDEGLAEEILGAVVDAVDVPVTLKIRTGRDKANRNGVRIAQIAERNGIQALTVHGRTRACRFSGEAEYETIRAIKQSVSIPVVANGDIDTPEKARQVLELTGADALMIGRATRGRPWIFREIGHYLETGHPLPEPEPAWVVGIVLEHLAQLYDFYGEHQGVRIARKHIAWYSKRYPEAVGFRDIINRTDSAGLQLLHVRNFFLGLPAKGVLAA
jgi:tRNA-dihydrouridine synthase B